MTKILVTGATSRAASRVGESSAWAQNDFELQTPVHGELDVTDLQNLEFKISLVKPDSIINFAGITDLKTCEAERNNQNGQVWQVNAIGAKNLAQLSKSLGFHLIQISTASVFAGKKEDPGPYAEAVEPETDDSKLSWYGLSKLRAEKYVQELAQDWTIIRLASTVRASAQSKPCLFRRWLSQSQQGTLPALFDDQQLTTTDLTELDVTLVNIIKQKLHGTYHVASPNLLSPYQIAQKLLHNSEIKRTSLTEEIKKGNKNLELFCPQFWGLNASLTSQKIGVKFSEIEESIAKFIQDDLS